MLRLILILLISIILISLLRGVIGIVGKAIAGLADPKTPSRSPSANPPAADELKRDPVCGLYVPASTAVRRTIAGEVMYFCSEACASQQAKQV